MLRRYRILGSIVTIIWIREVLRYELMKMTCSTSCHVLDDLVYPMQKQLLHILDLSNS